ncbi:MAG: RDD family protein [Burkholderiaceae bacterium]|nr:RDD family protein [Roseateles sp.]MBV8470675.1 RDD family protein [Burkholderiaceae bacterium]
MSAAKSVLQAPGLVRRLANFVYEGVLLFGIAVVTALIFSPLVQQRHALTHRNELMALIGLVFAIYFIYFWTRSGQTLAMKTWHLRVVDLQGRGLSLMRAAARFALAWAWFLPGLMIAYSLEAHEAEASDRLYTIFGCLIANVAGYALLSRLLPGRQFLHDVICGTCIVSQVPIKRSTA